MKRLLTMVAVAGLLVSSCSSGTDTEDAVVSALQASLLRDKTFERYEITEDEASCVATAAVTELGAERMIEIGVSEDEDAPGDDIDFDALSDAEIIVLADAMEACIANIDDLLVDAISEGILEEPDPDFPVTDEEARCVGEAMAEDFSLGRMILLGVRDSGAGNPFADLEPAEVEVFADAMVQCIDVRSILLSGIASSGAPEDVLACLDANITDADIEALFIAGFSGEDSDAAAQQILTPAVEACT